MTYLYGMKVSSIAETVPYSRLLFLVSAAEIAHCRAQRKAMSQEESSEVLGKRFHFCGRAVGCFEISDREPFSSQARFTH